MRKLAVSLLVLAVVLVGADFGFRLWAETVVADRIDEALGLPQRPDVDLHGFPFTVQVVQSRFPRADLEMEGLRVGGLVFRRAALELHRVRFPRGRLFSPGPATIRARSGRAVAEVTDDAVTEYLRRQGLPLTVEFVGPEVRASGTIEAFGFEVQASATTELSISDGALVFEPQEIEVGEQVTIPASALRFEIPLPQPIDGVRFDRLTVRDGVARVEGDLRDLSFRVEG